MRLRAALAARRAGLLTGGLLCIVIGCAFLTVALFIVIAASHGAGLAALVVGVIYVGFGLVFVGLSRRTPHSVRAAAAATAAAPPPAGTDAAALVTAFLSGLSAGVAAKKKST
ncbi:hypothetical protein R5H30_18055 [Sulfitobacter sp. D35]|uniref:hypothetical protein n=1 Tax=Sulfitobacter sp. D35 TaxID=3083252 RepID=UPI00296F651E|nr:hypothetical protein [Sulfitobacter sp. D35]MDW4499903.1 hypothetical protein [Sulfitobacter sp. D35]